MQATSVLEYTIKKSMDANFPKEKDRDDVCSSRSYFVARLGLGYLVSPQGYGHFSKAEYR